MYRRLTFAAGSLAVVTSVICGLTAAQAKDETIIGKGPTASKLDIVNELKQRGVFHKLLDGLQNSYDLDNELKGKGPYTFFAPDDKAFSHMPEEDRQSLFANNKKLRQVLTYHVVKGKHITSSELKGMKNIQSYEGELIALKQDKDKKGDEQLCVDKAHVKTADIECSNGIIHIIDAPIMPKLKK